MTNLQPQPLRRHRRANDYPDNTHRWQKGDLVIHRADAKEAHMLMVVVGYDAETGECKTRYLNPLHKPFLNVRQVWHNDLTALLDPAEFGIRVEDWK